MAASGVVELVSLTVNSSASGY